MVDSVGGDMSFRRTESGGLKINQNVEGLNVGEVVEALYEIKLGERDKYQSKIDKRTEELSALSDFETLTKAISGAAGRLRGADITGGESSFGKLTSVGRSSAETPPDQIVGVEFTGGTAVTQSFKIEVTQRASRDIATATRGVADKAAALEWDGTLTLGIDGGGTHNFTITEDMSLERVVSEVNAQKATTGVVAQIFQFGAGDFRLEFQAMNEGGVIDIAGADGLEGLVGDDESYISIGSGNTAEDLRAEFTLNDVVMTRTSNTINDIYAGVQIELRQAEAGTVIEVDIVQDTQTIRKDIEDFVTVYNETMKFISDQRARGQDGQPAEDSKLSNSPLLRSVFQEISDIVSMSVKGLDGDYRSLADIGISTDDSNGLKLIVDPSALEAAISSDINAVRKLFDFDVSSSNQSFDVATAPEKWVSELGILNEGDLITSATATLNKSEGGDFTATLTFNGDDYETDINVYGDYVYINGKAGTPFQGMVLVFSGAEDMDNDTSQATTMDGTQGVGSRLKGSLDKNLEPYIGDFSVEKDKIDTLNTRSEERKERIEARAERYKIRIEKQYQRLEAAWQQMKALMSHVGAVTDSWNKR